MLVVEDEEGDTGAHTARGEGAVGGEVVGARGGRQRTRCGRRMTPGHRGQRSNVEHRGGRDAVRQWRG
jgi:hypothetical protein